jgi:hypothetical protein
MQQTEETDLQQKLVKLWQPCPDSNVFNNEPKLDFYVKQSSEWPEVSEQEDTSTDGGSSQRGDSLLIVMPTTPPLAPVEVNRNPSPSTPLIMPPSNPPSPSGGTVVLLKFMGMSYDIQGEGSQVEMVVSKGEHSDSSSRSLTPVQRSEEETASGAHTSSEIKES